MAAGVAMTAAVLGAGLAMGAPAAQAVPPPNPPKHCDAGTDGAGCLPEGRGGGFSGSFVFLQVYVDEWGADWDLYQRSDGMFPTQSDANSLAAKRGYNSCELGYVGEEYLPAAIACRRAPNMARDKHNVVV